jgi:hypothetical protein
MSARSQNMRVFFKGNKPFQYRYQPINAWKFGLIIQDRRLRGTAYGLRKTHIPFQYLGDNGEIPNLQKTANYEDTQLLGRFEPIKTYSNSSDIKFTLNLVYFADGTERLSTIPRAGSEMIGPLQSPWTIEQITRISAKFESLVYPQYDGRYSPPRFCLLNIGAIFIDFPIVITSVNIQHLPPYSTRDLTPMRRAITLECSSYFPIYQAIGSDAILNQALDQDFTTGNTNFPRRVYSYRKFKRNQML